MKTIKLGNKIIEVDNKRGTHKVVKEHEFTRSEVRKEADGWHVTLKEKEQ